MKTTLLLAALICALTGTASAQSTATNPPAPPQATVETSTWFLQLNDFFRKDGPLNLYPSRRDGQWIAVVGSSRGPGGRYTYNTARYHGDMSGLTVQGESFQGTIKVVLGPDPWMPADRQVREVIVRIEGKLTPPPAGDAKAIRGITGTYQAKLAAGIRADTTEVSGTLGGAIGPTEIGPLDNVTYGVMLQDLIPGGKQADNQRRLWVGLGVRDGQVISAQIGPVNMKHTPYGVRFIEPPTAFTVTKDGLRGSVRFPFTSFDGDEVMIEASIEGGRVQGMLVGTYTATCTWPDGKTEKRSSTFDGAVNPGAAPNKFTKDERPWFVPVAGWKPVGAGEHPRLFFRKSDLPELRRRAATPEGQAIIKRLRALLDGQAGETMTTIFNPAKKGYSDSKFQYRLGAYSISHAAGYGFLYQLTGDKKYAEFARQCVELAWQGQRDLDDRYSWAFSSGELRAGPSIGWYAVAYDLCYEAWPEDFRVKFAQELQNYNSLPVEAEEGQTADQEGVSLRRMALAPRLGPNSNHYGAVAGGGLAVLAIKGDPGTDKELLEKYDTAFQRAITRAFSGGFGDGGFFHEGMGPGQVFSDTAFIPYIQALKTAQGRDYINGSRPHVANVTMVRVWELSGPPAVYPHRSSMPGSYGGPDFANWRGGLSRGGQFVQGFGTVRETDKPALLWCYNRVIEPDPAKHSFDTVSPYPHRAMLALLNWPSFTQVQEKNPATILPLYHRDTDYEYFVFRNRWQDSNDTVVTALLNSPTPGLKPRGLMVWGLGQYLELDAPHKTTVHQVKAARDRSVILDAENYDVAVDFSGASGAEVLVVCTSLTKPPAKLSPTARISNIKLGDQDCTVLTLSATGTHPELKAAGQTLTVGKQSVTLAAGQFRLAQFQATENNP